MVNISKKKIEGEIFDTISNRFIKYLTHFNKPKTTEQFLGELLSEKERIMLTKRFAIILMLDKRYHYNTIHNTLKVSLSTIAEIQRKRKNGDFKSFTNFILKNRNSRINTLETDDFISVIEKFLLAGMPPRYGGDRYRQFPRNPNRVEFRLKRKRNKIENKK